MPLETFERETVVGWDDSTKTAILTTWNKALMNKIDKLCKEHPNTYKLINEQEFEGSIYKEYQFSKRLVSFRAPTKRKMSEEQKKAAADRMRKMKAKEKEKKDK